MYKKSIQKKIKDHQEIELYRNEVNEVLSEFMDCYMSCLDNISLCKNLGLNNVEIGSNVKVVWKYLHNLYFITLDTKDEELVEKSSFNIENLIVPKSKEIVPAGSSSQQPRDLNGIQDMVSGLFNGGLMSIVSEVVSDLDTQLKGKDLSNIDPVGLFDKMLKGETDIDGINLKSIMEKTSSVIQSKVSSGELDIDEIKKTSEKIMTSLNQ